MVESEPVGPVGAVDEASAGDVGAVLGPAVGEETEPGVSVAARPGCVRPGRDWPGCAGPLTLWSGWSREPAVSDAGFASMAWAPT